MMCFLLRPVESIDFDPLISMSNSMSMTLILSINSVYCIHTCGLKGQRHIIGMAIPVVKFSREGYKIRVLAKNQHNIQKGNH